MIVHHSRSYKLPSPANALIGDRTRSAHFFRSKVGVFSPTWAPSCPNDTSQHVPYIDHHISIFKLFRKMIRNQTKSEKTPRATVFSYSTRCNWRPLIGDLFLPHFLHRPRWRWCSIGGCSSTGWTMEPTWCPAWVAASLPSRSLDNLRKLFYDFF